MQGFDWSEQAAPSPLPPMVLRRSHLLQPVWHDAISASETPLGIDTEQEGYVIDVEDPDRLLSPFDSEGRALLQALGAVGTTQLYVEGSRPTQGTLLHSAANESSRFIVPLVVLTFSSQTTGTPPYPQYKVPILQTRRRNDQLQARFR